MCTASGTMVASGGSEIVSGCGTSLDAIVSGGGSEIVFGVDNGASIFGTLVVASGGLVGGTLIGGGAPAVSGGANIALFGQYAAAQTTTGAFDSASFLVNSAGTGSTALLTDAHT